MTAFKLENFGGIRPRMSRRLLPNNSAVTAENTKLLEGELRGYHQPTILKDLSSLGFTVGRAYRIPLSVTSTVGGIADAWLGFESPNTDIIRSPVLGDQFNRYYWASDNGEPMYNTLARIVAGNTGANAPYLLGIPEPVNSLIVTPSVAGTDETRSYVYTFVSAYGEEGPPSNPTTFTGDASATTWTLTNFSTAPIAPYNANTDITKVNIYRTVPNASNPGFFFVAQVAIGTTTYADISTDVAVALNNTLDFVDNFPPPLNMEGIALMPGGFMLGFQGRNLLMTEPYLPHAWNPTYNLATEFEIVGIVIWSQTAIICTTSNLYLGSGSTPDAFTLQKLDGVTPCLSRRGIVSTVSGVYFPTVDGLAMFNVGGLNTITQPILTKEEWATFGPDTILAAQLGLQYIAYSSSSFGFQINPTEQSAEMATITAFNEVTGVETDRYTGNPYLIINNVCYDWDPSTATRLYWHWVSKEVQFPKFLNLGAFKIKADFGSVNVSENILATFGPYNTARFNAGPLNPLGSNVLGGISPYNLGLVAGNHLPENMMPLGGGPLYNLAELESQEIGVRLVVYCNGIKVSDQTVTDDKIRRLPSGFKHDLWQFEMFGNTNMYSLQVAETEKN